MNVLTPVPIRSATALAGVVAQSLGSLAPGATVLERGFVAGEALVDLVGRDAEGSLLVVVVDVDADTAAVVRAVEGAAWCRENGALLARVFAGAEVATGAPPRAVLVAGHLSDRALRFLRTLGPLAPDALECRVFELNGGLCVAYERVGERRAGADARGGPEGGRTQRPAAVSAGVAPVAREPVAAAREAVEESAAERAQRMIERLEALDFRQVFPA